MAIKYLRTTASIDLLHQMQEPAKQHSYQYLPLRVVLFLMMSLPSVLSSTVQTQVSMDLTDGQHLEHTEPSLPLSRALTCRGTFLDSENTCRAKLLHSSAHGARSSV